jgi:5-oxoprolinase (ATP-hydrolysing)
LFKCVAGKESERFALLTTKKLKDLCEIGTQARSRLFDLNIRKPGVLYQKVVEIKERVTIDDFTLNPFPVKRDLEADPTLVLTASGEIVRIMEPLDEKNTSLQLQHLRNEGFKSVAVCLMHSNVFPGMNPNHYSSIERSADHRERP